MNILPFIFIFLALFATLSTCMLSKGRALSLEHKAYSAYMDAKRKAHQAAISATYAKIPTLKNPSDQSEEYAPKITKNWRQQPGKHKLARLNIYTLLHCNDPPQHLVKTFYSLMDELYANLPIYVELKKEGRLPTFFEAWQKTNDFDNVSYDDPDFTLLLYKMRKGCVCYDTEASVGYPPLEDFIALANVHAANRPMPWRLARPPLLRAYFGQLAATILSLEAENPYTQATLTRRELDELLQDYPDIPTHLLDNAVGNTSDLTIIGASSLTEVRYDP